ncbi:MAG TPA: polyprenyl synthetase family protein [Clostridiales bacterium]|nr:polyprenyl synthetase family protein [Clostridiales bacterium]
MIEKSEQRLKEYISLIEQKLIEYNKKSSENLSQGNVIDAMNYSLQAGGKRIRPVLTLEFCRICGVDYNKAISSACAIEMVHTFSLIHDDLPAMDDDDFRRGKFSCHKAFGEDVAILAGDALSARAFEIIVNDKLLDSDTKIKLIQVLADAVGVNGMIGGQVIDMENESKNDLNNDDLTQMCLLKTGALLRAACKMGCIVAGADEKVIENADEFAKNIGLAFQIVDDILDVTSTQDLLGKPIGSDAQQNKTTFVALNGIDEAKNKAETLTNKALLILKEFDDSEFLSNLTKLLLVRES